MIVGSVTTGINEFTAVAFNGGVQTLLQTPTGANSGANDVSPNGEYIGGFVSFEDLTLFETINHAVVWVNGQFTQLQDSNGDAFEGKVISVSDNGYAVGQSSDGRGFIWHPSFAGVRMFDEWLLTEHGETLPTPATAVSDVLFAGNQLHFAVNGSAYFVSAEVDPFPWTNKFLPTDTNADGQVTALDALIVINALNRNSGSFAVPVTRPTNNLFPDTNMDGQVSPIDALRTINELNRAGSGIITAKLVPLGANLDLVGVGVQNDGDTVLVGNRFNSGSGLNEGVIFEIEADDGSVSESLLGSFGGETFVSSVSPNGQYVTGTSKYSDGTPLSGFLAEVSNSGVLTATGGLGLVPESFGFDVSNSGVVVGTTDGLGVPYSWSESTGIVGLTAPNGGGAQGISNSGAIVGFIRPSNVEADAVLFQGGNQILLETPDGFNSLAIDISPNGQYIGGLLQFEDLTLFETINQAVVWVNGELTTLQDAEGNAFEGKVNAVSDNGYAVGQGSDGLGFIWHESFAGVRMFDEWLLTEFGATLTGAVTSVVDVLSNGHRLNFAVTGINALVTTSVPPTTS